jgi:hypothetical protein
MMSSLSVVAGLALLVVGAQAAASNNCGSGNGSPESCFSATPAAGGVGASTCCWVEFASGDRPLCLGHDVAISWGSNGRSTIRCSPESMVQMQPARLAVVGVVVASVGMVALTAGFVAFQKRRNQQSPLTETPTPSEDP